MSAVLHVNGWTVSEINGEPTVRDTDLAEKLGYSRPRDIRKIIERMIDNGSFVGATPCRTPEVIAGNLTEVFYLTQKQALKVISKSETKIADAIMDEVIDVFLAYRKGQLQPVLDYEGGKVAHILHGFKHEINPTAFLNVALISKFERMFGEKKVREFYSQIIGIQVEEVRLASADEGVKMFASACTAPCSTTFTSNAHIFSHYLAFCDAHHMVPMFKDHFFRQFLRISGAKKLQKRFGHDRHLGYMLRLLEIEGK